MDLMLVQRTPEDALQYLQELWPRYREDLIRAGSSEAEADMNIERNRAALAPEGTLAAGHFVFQLMLGSDHIGNLWLSQRDNSHEWFIYDLEVFEGFRRRGFARQAMELAQAFALNHGGTRLGLSVFGFNTAARFLYESLGYRIVSMGMIKDLA